ncbi:uncharacterized protein LOC111714398 [Eurytemora carolleeae]|uniref:uncharacterized protein LOC111714398 n=1 Tax=Eurytemora carolleeae TaxID=1294199 RepID=UPI000C78C785|nr:uncharacterized protein LOC111714398 [Eurytemora carolleeae]|eukprot:XP_023345268.1 uncharacterized protein LOC111714398 [Eurytemora affinis]
MSELSRVPEYRERIDTEEEEEDGELTSGSSRESSLEREKSRLAYNDAGERASEYLRSVLGTSLNEILTECAQTRPDDPLAFIAQKLEKIGKDRNTTVNTRVKSSDTFKRSIDTPLSLSASVNEVDERRLPPSTVSSAPESSKIPKWKEIVSAASSAPSANGVSSAPSSTWSYNSYQANPTRRSLSLNALRDDQTDGTLPDTDKKQRKKKKKTPTVAMTADDYRKKRGIIQVRKTEDENPAAAGQKKSRRKPRPPSILTDDFDIQKHFERSRKMRDQRLVKER